MSTKAFPSASTLFIAVAALAFVMLGTIAFFAVRDASVPPLSAQADAVNRAVMLM